MTTPAIASDSDIPEFLEYTGRSVLANRWLNIWSIGTPLFGAVAALASLPFLGITQSTLWMFLGLFLLNGFGVCIGLHRFFTHHAFETSKIFSYVLAILGTASFQGPINRWVADHRRHHRYSDQPWDLHSPYWRADRALPMIEGLWHAHLGWMLLGHISSLKRYAPEIGPATVGGWASRHYFSICLLGLVLPALIGLALGGPEESVRCFLWAGCFRVSALHQATWCVNSVCHRFGKRLDGAKDESRDNLLFTYLILGEGLHSTHHRYPTAGVKGPAWKDWSGAVLLVLERLGVVWSLRRAPVTP